MTDHTPHQKKIIQRYYEHLDAIALAKLGEIVSELYLAETESRANRLWKQTESAMKKLDIPDSIKRQILAQRDPEVLARNLKNWLNPPGTKGGSGPT